MCVVFIKWKLKLNPSQNTRLDFLEHPVSVVLSRWKPITLLGRNTSQVQVNSKWQSVRPKNFRPWTRSPRIAFAQGLFAHRSCSYRVRSPLFHVCTIGILWCIIGQVWCLKYRRCMYMHSLKPFTFPRQYSNFF